MSSKTIAQSRPRPKKTFPQVRKGIYSHFKGGFYKVIGCGWHSETLEELVFYVMLSNNTLWARPKKMFLERVAVKINRKKKTVPRYKFVRDCK